MFKKFTLEVENAVLKHKQDSRNETNYSMIITINATEIFCNGSRGVESPHRVSN